MPILDRAAQFSPFAALTGYDAAIKESARLTHQRIELSEDQLQELNRKQQLLIKNLMDQPKVAVTYFVPDERKQGGAYITVSGRVKRIDPNAGIIILTDHTEISQSAVLDLESDLFRELM